MKKLSLFVILNLVSLSVFAGISQERGKFYIKTKNGKAPIMKVNELLSNKKIKDVTLYGKGKVNALSFKSGNERKLYSVDSKGFIYSIEPFTNYDISKIHNDGRFEFRQIPNRKYTVNDKGFFLY